MQSFSESQTGRLCVFLRFRSGHCEWALAGCLSRQRKKQRNFLKTKQVLTGLSIASETSRKIKQQP
jgi:hypothetical protein